MEFFHSQESLTTIQWILRAIFSFIFLLLATKVMGERTLSQLRLIDFTIALILGNILAHPLSDEQLGLKGSLITTISTHYFIPFLCFHEFEMEHFQEMVRTFPLPSNHKW